MRCPAGELCQHLVKTIEGRLGHRLVPTVRSAFLVNDLKVRTKMLGREPLCRTFRANFLL